MKLVQNFLSFSLLSIVYSYEATLKQLHILFRHGDRTPISHYKSDPYQDPSFWPEGSGQLTNIGKSMEYSLGLWLRDRYRHFYKDQFNSSEINVFSTDYDRTLMSAQCVLAALFYPTNSTRFRDDVNWVPTPIHSAPSGYDMLLNVDAACPRIAEEIKKVDALPEVVRYFKEHTEVMKYLTKYSGQKVNTLMEVDFIYDTLHIEQMRNLTLPAWTKPYMKTMEEMSVYSFFLSSYSKELKRLRGGPLLGSITNHMRKTLTSKNATEANIYMYSAHDSNVAILLGTMGVYNFLNPPYAATLLWELHQDGTNEFVRLFYQNDSTMASPPHQLTIPGCVADCPLNDWEHLFQDLIPSDWNSECGRPDPIIDHYYIVTLSGLCGIFGCILLVFISVILYFMVKKSKFSSSTLDTLGSNSGYVIIPVTSEAAKGRSYYGSFDFSRDTIDWVAES